METLASPAGSGGRTISSFSTIWGFPSLSRGTAVTWDGPPRDFSDPRTGGLPRRFFPVVAGVAEEGWPPLWSSSSAPSTKGVTAFVGVKSAGFRGGLPRFRFMTGAGTGMGIGSSSSSSSSTSLASSTSSSTSSSSSSASPSEPSLSVGGLDVSMSVGPSRGVFVLFVFVSSAAAVAAGEADSWSGPGCGGVSAGIFRNVSLYIPFLDLFFY